MRRGLVGGVLLLLLLPVAAWGQAPRLRDTQQFNQMQRDAQESARQWQYEQREAERDRREQFRETERQWREDRRQRQLRDAIEERDR